MKTNYKKYFWIAAVIGVVFILLFFRQCSESRNLKQSRESVQNYLNDTIAYYKNENGQIVAEKTALQGKKELLEILLSETSGQLAELTKKFKEISAAGEVGQEVRIDTIKIPYEIPVPCEFVRNIYKLDDFYTIYGISTNKVIAIDSLIVPNTLSFAIGEKKTTFWKSEYRIEAVNSNPYVHTTGLDAYSFSQPKKRFGISVYAGIGISENFTFVPQIGLGVTFDLFRF